MAYPRIYKNQFTFWKEKSSYTEELLLIIKEWIFQRLLGTNLFAVTDGQITFVGFLGGGGYTITLSVGNLKISYCHVSPNYLVQKGQIVKRGDKIGNVGPKNVYQVPGNPYKDSLGNPTNGATTGPHLHLGMRLNNEYVNPMDFFK